MGGGKKLDFTFLFLITVPISFSVFVKEGLELGLKHLFEMLSGFVIFTWKLFSPEDMGLGVGSFLNWAPASVAEPARDIS